MLVILERFIGLMQAAEPLGNIRLHLGKAASISLMEEAAVTPVSLASPAFSVSEAISPLRASPSVKYFPASSCKDNSSRSQATKAF